MNVSTEHKKSYYVLGHYYQVSDLVHAKQICLGAVLL